jgi:hypothetical protein
VESEGRVARATERARREDADVAGEAETVFCRVRARPRVRGHLMLAPCGGRRRARSFLFEGGPRVGRRDRKIPAEKQELRRCVRSSRAAHSGMRNRKRRSGRCRRRRASLAHPARGSRTLAKPTPPARAQMRRSAPVARPMRDRRATKLIHILGTAASDIGVGSVRPVRFCPLPPALYPSRHSAGRMWSRSRRYCQIASNCRRASPSRCCLRAVFPSRSANWGMRVPGSTRWGL